MTKTVQTPLPFKKLLDYCSDRSSPYWETGWREFIIRYKLYIYKSVIQCCRRWNVPRLHRQFSETVNDVVSEVFMILCKNECQNLKAFRRRDNERLFRSWLVTICNREASRYIKHQYLQLLAEEDIEQVKNELKALQYDVRWELFDALVQTLRDESGRKRRHLERNINIFQFYIMGDFTPRMITSHPCLKQLGYRVVDNVVNRLRNLLRNGNIFNEI